MASVTPGEPLDPSSVVKVTKVDGTVVGAGFIVSESLVLTCAHVVCNAGAGPGGVVRLVCAHLPGSPQEAEVPAEWWRGKDDEDVAVLRLASPLVGARVLALGSEQGCEGHDVESFGFPTGAPAGGHRGCARVAGPLDRDGVVRLQLHEANDLTNGFSGGPVFDKVTGTVVGMVSEVFRPDELVRGLGIAYATPTSVLRRICPELAVTAVCPYLGLKPFTAEHAAWFHGRAKAVDQLLEEIVSHGLLLLLGPSGAGKSSLVQAGLLPALAAGRLPGSASWTIIVVARPGNDLAGSLEDAGIPGVSDGGIVAAVDRRLASQPPGTRLVLVVDHFEELLTPSGSAEQAARQHDLLDQLVALVEQVPSAIMVLIMRDDFYSQLAALAADLLAAAKPGLFNIPATLDSEDLQNIITRPAYAVGLRFESGLAEQIITDVLRIDQARTARRHAPVTVLPLLELALEQLWRGRRDGTLTHGAYQGAGGVAGSLPSWCDTKVGRLSLEQQAAARRMLTALVRPADPDHCIPPVRRQVPLATLYELADSPPDSPGSPDRGAEAVLRALALGNVFKLDRFFPDS